MYKSKSFEDAVAKAEKLVADGGYGHTSSLYADSINHPESRKVCKCYEDL